ncbi:MAG: hypothetical protein ACRYHQ_40995 [Janthinobacterium lividum]
MVNPTTTVWDQTHSLISYFDGDFTRVYVGQGLAPNEANIVISLEPVGSPAPLSAADLVSWQSYVDCAHDAGVVNVAPIVSPNGGNEDISSWDAPYWQSVQEAASTGGGLTVDPPPPYQATSGTHPPATPGTQPPSLL